MFVAVKLSLNKWGNTQSICLSISYMDDWILVKPNCFIWLIPQALSNVKHEGIFHQKNEVAFINRSKALDTRMFIVDHN